MADTQYSLDGSYGAATHGIYQSDAYAIAVPLIGTGLTVPTVYSVDASSNAHVDVTFDQIVDYASVIPTPPAGNPGWTTGTFTQPSSITIRQAITDVSPTITNVDAGVDGIAVTFDLPVNIGAPVFGGVSTGWELPGTLSQINASKIQIDVDDVPPDLLEIGGNPFGLYLSFNGAITATAPIITPPVGENWTFSSVTPGESWLVDVTGVPPTLQALTGHETNGLDLEFDLPVNLGTPTIVAQPASGWELNGTDSQIDPVTIRIGITPLGVGGVSLVSCVPGVRSIRLTFNEPLSLEVEALLPENWPISTVAPGAVDVEVTKVVLDGSAVILTTTEATTGKIYNLTIPGAYIHGALTGDLYSTPLNINFTAIGDSPSVLKTRIIDESNIDLIFNEGVSGAENPANYSFEPFLLVTGVTRLSAVQYRITVEGKRYDQLYELTVSNIVDLANNPMS